jgi:hypothetical protein
VAFLQLLTYRFDLLSINKPYTERQEEVARDRLTRDIMSGVRDSVVRALDELRDTPARHKNGELVQLLPPLNHRTDFPVGHNIRPTWADDLVQSETFSFTCRP